MNFSATFFAISVFLVGLSNQLDSITFQYSEIDSAVVDLIWCGNRNEDIFALSELNSVYKSEDRGFSWRRMNDIFHQNAAMQLESNENEVRLVNLR
jgi:hypothetical protein